MKSCFALTYGDYRLAIEHICPNSNKPTYVTVKHGRINIIDSHM